jgi:prepilin-type N-terminal cleavage/methylation domain-containing protein
MLPAWPARGVREVRVAGVAVTVIVRNLTMGGVRGFTVVEVMVAVMILSVGLMGMVTTAGVVTRMIGTGHRLTQASSLAAGRVEWLRARGCPAAGRGGETRGSFIITWQVSEVSGGRARGIVVRVTRPTTGGARTDSLATVQLCP